MPKFAANLSLLFTEYDFQKRFVHAAAAGFKGVEYLFPYDHTATALRQLLDDNQLEQVLFNLPAGNWGAGERGLACLPDRRQEFQDSVHLALEYACTLGNSLIHCMAGIKPEGLSTTAALTCYLENLHYAAQAAAEHDRIICIEPINHFDMPGYFLNYSQQALDIVHELNHDNIKLQFDIYHAQRMEGHICFSLERLLPYIAHIQIANTPGRHEPHLGELNYDFIFHFLKQLQYSGWIGCEYIPALHTGAGLSWLQPYLHHPH
ncbi:MAG TPA: hydroxypyruvate isomerase family protein [Paenalcaligenes hominis]|uniref:Hydroxypyruvate isomerase family protein n=1 Tax=Paenalcaligenes hominis TaxID=643674 RepID=A0A9D2VED2_9BURK|nr:hydroxypyruvate isomerase family protein [Paenalcaligenes hominis]